LHQQIGRLRWQVPVIALLLVVAHQMLARQWWGEAGGLKLAVDIAVYGIAGPVVMWLALGWTQRRVAAKEAAEAELVRTHAELAALNRRMGVLLQIHHRLAEAGDEEALADLALQLPAGIVPALGCALVRFDSHSQPMPVEYRGMLDETAVNAWQQHLGSHATTDRCEACRLRVAESLIVTPHSCPLRQRLPLTGVGPIICLPLERNGHDYGILGLFLAEGQELDPEEHELLSAVVAEIAIAFENVRLRTRELATLYDVNEALQQRLGFDRLMARLLARTLAASSADAAVVLLQEDREADPGPRLVIRYTAGGWEGVQRLPHVTSLAAGVLASGEPAVVNSEGGDPDSASLLLAPMTADDGPLGVIVLGSRRRKVFQRAHVRLVATIAGQAGLLAQNAQLYARLEHQAIVAERARLAREMHDGLAQTLGYLKMRARQIARWVEAGQGDAASAALRGLAEAADEAYRDVRAALDGLRLPLEAEGDSLAVQLRRAVATFSAQSGLAVELALDADPELAPSSQAHLLRIVQEALTNVRRHAGARHVELSLRCEDECCRLMIADDGRGFAAGEAMPTTRHGLRVIRERADLLGADLQIHSAPGAGTRVLLEWPLVVR
jgi:two-component system nitrate/nitrite sensor histidine kinase NarX